MSRERLGLALVILAFAAVAAVAASGAEYLVNAQALDEITTPFTIDEVTKAPLTSAFRPAASLPSTRRYVGRWYRFEVPPANGPDVVLDLDAAVSDADLYYLRRDGTYGVVQFGMGVPFDKRSYPVPWPSLRLTREIRAAKTLYLRTYGPTTTFSIQPAADYERFRSNLARGTIFFVGFVTSIGILSFFFAFYLRYSAFGFHALLMFAAAVLMLTINGLAWEYLWPWASVDFNAARSSAFLAYLLAFLLFTDRFLRLGTIRRLDVAIWVSFGLNVIVLLILQPLYPDTTLLVSLEPLISLITGVLILAAAIIRLRQGFPYLRFFLVGFSGMLVIFTIGEILHAYSRSRWAFNLGVAFDSLFFQFALADRIISANRERDSAQRKELKTQEALVVSQAEKIVLLQQHNRAFSRFVPDEFLRRLGRAEVMDVELGDHVESTMAVLFSDIRSFTALSEQMSPADSFEFVNEFFAHVGPAIRANGGFIDKYIGDAVMGLFADPSDRAVDAAIAMHEEVWRFNENRARRLKPPIMVGVGVHFGTLMLGTIGDAERLETTVISDAVNVASRIEGLTRIYGARIIVTQSLIDSLSDPSNYHTRFLGAVTLKGLTRPVEIFEVCDADEPEMLLKKMETREAFETAQRAFLEGDLVRSQSLFDEVIASNPGDVPAIYCRSLCGPVSA